MNQRRRKKVRQRTMLCNQKSATWGLHLRGVVGIIRNTTVAYQTTAFLPSFGGIHPEHHFSYRWHPYAVDPAVDYSAEPTTLVEFHLEDTDGGTALTIVESGFDRIPLGRRAEAFRMNDNGWTGQIKQLAKYVE